MWLCYCSISTTENVMGKEGSILNWWDANYSLRNLYDFIYYIIVSQLLLLDFVFLRELVIQISRWLAFHCCLISRTSWNRPIFQIKREHLVCIRLEDSISLALLFVICCFHEDHLQLALSTESDWDQSWILCELVD